MRSMLDVGAASIIGAVFIFAQAQKMVRPERRRCFHLVRGATIAKENRTVALLVRKRKWILSPRYNTASFLPFRLAPGEAHTPRQVKMTV